MTGVFHSEWFWLVVAIAIFVALTLLIGGDGCGDGYYREDVGQRRDGVLHFPANAEQLAGNLRDAPPGVVHELRDGDAVLLGGSAVELGDLRGRDDTHRGTASGARRQLLPIPHAHSIHSSGTKVLN